MSYIICNHLSKVYSKNKKSALKEFHLSINKGEFIVLIGPSGSGKSTLLELLCGFQSPTQGQLLIDGEDMTPIEPKDRGVAMVFQNDTLFPHLNIYENIAFGMRIRKEDKQRIHEKVKWAAQLLELEPYLEAKPHELSGGERQRVAIGRAIVREPKLFLMDEPLSHLDATLRYSTAEHILNIHRKLEGTTLYVTHDQREALMMADRLVVLRDGVIQQVGTPKEIYERPANLFVAQFIGKPEMNIVPIRYRDNKIWIKDKIAYAVRDPITNVLNETDSYLLGIRAEHIRYTTDSEGFIEAEVQQITYLGSETLLKVVFEETVWAVKASSEENFEVGQRITLSFDIQKTVFFDAVTLKNVKEQ